jgi:transaldolase
MSTSIKSLIATGTNLYLDSVDPNLVRQNIEWGAVGATSNPIIIADLIKKGTYDEMISQLASEGLSDHDICWTVNDRIVQAAQDAFLPIWKKSKGDAGWVSFELDPLVDDPTNDMKHAQRVENYIELGRKWSKGHQNRMIKIPATAAGIDAASTLAADGITLNVTLVFTERQYNAARDQVWAGARRRSSLDQFKSVYSIFVSRIDQYTTAKCPQLSEAAQGQYGILNAKRIFALNDKFWQANPTALKQEIIFASTGTKNPKDPAWKYVEALAGADIQTNPPATNDAVANSGRSFSSRVHELPAANVQAELDAAVDIADMEATLMAEGLEKFATPQKNLLATVKKVREQLVAK